MPTSSPTISDSWRRGRSCDCLLKSRDLHSDRYMLRYQECIPCEQLVMQLCDIKQAYTGFGGETIVVSICERVRVHKEEERGGGCTRGLEVR